MEWKHVTLGNLKTDAASSKSPKLERQGFLALALNERVRGILSGATAFDLRREEQ